MARSLNGINDALRSTSAPVTAAPLTIACWFRQNTSAAQLLVSIGVNGGIDRFQMFTNGPGTLAVVAQILANGHPGTGANAFVSGTPSAGQWHHAAAVFASSTSRTAYWNGAGGTPETTAVAPSGVNSVVIGARYNTTLGAYFAGGIAEVAIWNDALTAEEIAAHAAGFSADQIRLGALVYYADLIRDLRDLRGGLTISELGTGTAFAEHPRIIL